MSIKDDLKETLQDLNIGNINVDKNYNYKGRDATKVEFTYADGYSFESIITDDLKIPDAEKVALIDIGARNRLQGIRNGFDMEVER